MVTIEPIKNQYLTALKERQQIIDKVNEIIKDLNNLNFNDLINLNNKIEEIKIEIAQIENDLSGKVNKNGDIISGSLQLNTDADNTYIIKRSDLDRSVTPLYPVSDDANVQTLVTVLDKNNSTLSYIQRSERPIGTILSHVINQTANGSIRNHQMNQVIGTDGSLYVTIPSWSVGTNDNSDKILTIKMANSLPSLVHTTGNERIAGYKDFVTGIGLKSDGTKSINFTNENGDNQGYLSMTNGNIWFKSNNGNITLEVPNGTANAPDTPSTAISNEIATANWVISKINELATKNNLAGL